MMKIDCHVHCVGDGSDGSGCWMDLGTLSRKIMGRLLLRNIGLPSRLLHGGFDVAYRERLLHCLRTSSLDRAVLLAQDVPYDHNGNVIPGAAVLYVPNDYVRRLADEHPEFIPAASIHPARSDALRELERCLKAGFRVLKLLPNCHNVDCSAPRYREFWQMMAEGRMIFLAHTGGESTLTVVNPAYEDPTLLRGPLECGVTTIAAHGAGQNNPWGRHYTPLLLEIMAEYPHLYADNSALTTLNRYGTVPELLPPNVQERVLYGSDYPVPVSPWGPWFGGLYDAKARRKLCRIENPLERDYQAKRRMGFSEETFTRLATLLELTA